MKDRERTTPEPKSSKGPSDLWLWLAGSELVYWIAGAIAIAVVALFNLPQEKTFGIFLVTVVLLMIVGFMTIALVAALVARRQRLKMERQGELPK